MSQILLIGYGAIGQYVFNALKTSAHSRVAQVLCRAGREIQARAALAEDVSCINDPSAVEQHIDLVVECAGHAALISHVPTLLRGGRDVICVSNGALSDAAVALQLEQAAFSGASSLHLLSGAIGGMDILSAARSGGLDSVRYRGHKPPASWKGSKAEKSIELDAITEAVTHFEGTARQAASDFPQNANVAATVALAGIGLDETMVELIADPALTTNRHEIEAVGAFGKFSLVVEGRPLPGNPKSSALTAMSVVQAIERHNASMLVG